MKVMIINDTDCYMIVSKYPFYPVVDMIEKAWAITPFFTENGQTVWEHSLETHHSSYLSS